jgi:hypothetical protein
MKNLLSCLGNVMYEEKLIPANLLVLGLTSLNIDMLLKVILTSSMIILTGIKIYKELSNKNTENHNE